MLVKRDDAFAGEQLRSTHSTPNQALDHRLGTSLQIYRQFGKSIPDQSPRLTIKAPWACIRIGEVLSFVSVSRGELDELARWLISEVPVEAPLVERLVMEHAFACPHFRTAEQFANTDLLRDHVLVAQD